MTRSKTSWEAADTGLLMWRSSFRWLFPFVIIPFGIVAGCVRLLPDAAWAWTYLILWWLKPFFDRFILHVIAIRFFEPKAGVARLLRGLPASLTRGLAGDLLWRRFSPWRASHIPVRVLEATGRKNSKRRLQILASGGLNFCALLTILGLVLEGALMVGEWFFARAMLELVRPDYVEVMDNFSSAGVFFFVVFCLNYLLVESVYVCMGFGLYINSRVEVEGWDLELLFQRFASAKSFTTAAESGNTTKPVQGIVAPLLCLALCCLVPAAGHAQDADGGKTRQVAEPIVEAQAAPFSATAEPMAEAQDTPLSATREPMAEAQDIPLPAQTAIPSEALFPLAELEEILASRDFGGKRETWVIRFKSNENEGQPLPDWDMASWVEKIKLISAQILRVLVIIVIVVALGFAAHYLYRRRGALIALRKSRGYGVSVHEGEAPAVLLARARVFYTEGLYRDAWAACFSATCAAWSGRGVNFPPGATECECLALVRVSGASETVDFTDLVRTWIGFAYGGIAPQTGAFEKASAFCESLIDNYSVVLNKIKELTTENAE